MEAKVGAAINSYQAVGYDGFPNNAVFVLNMIKQKGCSQKAAPFFLFRDVVGITTSNDLPAFSSTAAAAAAAAAATVSTAAATAAATATGSLFFSFVDHDRSTIKI